MQCEHRTNPLGIDERTPRLSWRTEAEGRGWRQTAYQVLAASTAEALDQDAGDVWDSGKVLSDQSVHLEYAGPPLKSGRRYWWKVRVWDADNRPSAFSAPAWWEMGLLDSRDWKAQWISGSGALPADKATGVPPSPLLRKSVMLPKPVRSARIHVSGLGFYELRVNGRKAGDNVLDPLITRYDRRVLYVTHDVTDLLVAGENAIGVMLGNGWYNSHTKGAWNFDTAPWRDLPKLLLQLQITFADGAQTTLGTDVTWRATAGPVTFDGLRNGETHDARAEKPGWDRPGYDDSAWAPAVVTPGPGGTLQAQTLPIRVMQTIAPAAVREAKPGVFVFDLGQNMAGWAQLTVAGPAGTQVALRYAENLAADGDIDQSNINSFVQSGACQTDRYVLKGEGTEVWEPRFTYHGFRYVQVTGFPGSPTLDSLRGRVVHSAFESAGEFTSSNDALNRLQACARWSYIGNFVGIPTDCPHREKCGWTGDAQLAAETGLFNFAAAPAYEKWLNDFEDVQRHSGQLPGIVPTGGWGYNWGSGPAWDSACINLPWYLYLYGGTRRALECHYPMMKRYVDFMTTMATAHIVSFGLGDWCSPGKPGEGYKTPEALTSTGYYYSNCTILSRTATLLGKKGDARKYASLARKIRKAFNRAFYDRKTGRYAGNAQTSMACALFQGLADEGEREKIVAALARRIEETEGHPDYGVLGAKYVPNVLTEHGRTDLAYRMAVEPTYPSLAYWVQQGATTLWENWDGQHSRNHIMFGDISAWMFKALAGINPDPEQPGFKHTIIRPRLVPGLAWAQAEHASPYGPVRSAWSARDGRLTLEVCVPPNATATIFLPTGDAESVREGGKPAAQAEGVRFLETVDGSNAFLVGSGTYQFEGNA